LRFSTSAQSKACAAEIDAVVNDVKRRTTTIWVFMIAG
jgi:hypothetical protein